MTLNRLTELEQAATKGPWGADGYGDTVWAGEGTVVGFVGDGWLPNLALIAEARNALPALLAVARAARGFEAAYQMALGSASAFDVLNRDEKQRELREAFARLDGEDAVIEGIRGWIEDKQMRRNP